MAMFRSRSPGHGHRHAYAHAHCDIPCGIYDPHAAQVASHTVFRMVTLIKELPSKQADEDTKKSLLARYTASKEQHAELTKHELRILWADYFKPEHVQAHPDLHDTFWKALKLASSARQNVDAKAATDLVGAVNKIAEIYWKTKGVTSATHTAPYPTAQPMVLPQLK